MQFAHSVIETVVNKVLSSIISDLSTVAGRPIDLDTVKAAARARVFVLTDAGDPL